MYKLNGIYRKLCYALVAGIKAEAVRYLHAETGMSALPTEWLTPASKVAQAFVPVIPTSMGSAFWERSSNDRPAFLGVAKREAAR